MTEPVRVLVPADLSDPGGDQVEGTIVGPYYGPTPGWRGSYTSNVPTGHWVELPDGRRQVYFLAAITFRPVA